MTSVAQRGSAELHSESELSPTLSDHTHLAGNGVA